MRLAQSGALPIGEGEPLPPENSTGSLAGPAELHDLFRDHSRDLVRHLARHTGCHETARDLAQETFLRVSRRAPIRVLGIRRPEAYLKAISRNLLRDWGRSRSRRTHFSATAAECTEDHVDQIAVLESRDTLRRVEQALSKMKPKTREIFLAHRLDGLSYAEIAELTGLSISGVEKQMIKAIAKIDRFLDRN